MTRITFEDFKDSVLTSLDMDREDFVLDKEFIQYTNDAIGECEAVLHKTNKDYFLKNARLKDTTSPVPNTGLISGVSEYALPTDIYANKIKEILYNNGSEVYEITRRKSPSRLGEMEAMNNQVTGRDYLFYLFVNDNASAGMRIRLYPTPRETGDYVSIWYYRSAERIPKTPTGAEYIDIPEFYTYIKAAVSAKCAIKEGHPRTQTLIGEWQYLRELMLNTLFDQTASDDESLVYQDLSHYNNHT